MKNDRLGDKARLKHILQALEEIKQYIAGADFDVFSTNTMMYNACIRQLEIIGEAANRLTLTLTEQYTNIPWYEIVGLRNLLIHEYFGVKLDVVWEVIQRDLLPLQKDIEAILESLA